MLKTKRFFLVVLGFAPIMIYLTIVLSWEYDISDKFIERTGVICQHLGQSTTGAASYEQVQTFQEALKSNNQEIRRYVLDIAQQLNMFIVMAYSTLLILVYSLIFKTSKS